MNIQVSTVLIFAGIVTMFALPVIFVIWLLDSSWRITTGQSMGRGFFEAGKRLYRYIIKKFL